MQHRRARAEARAEPADHLRRKRNFRHEHDGGFAQRERLAHGADVHFRLAAARYAAEEKFPIAAAQRGQNLGKRGFLIARQLRVGGLFRRLRREGTAQRFFFAQRNETALDELFQPFAAEGAHFRRGARARRQRAQDLLPFRGALFGLDERVHVRVRVGQRGVFGRFLLHAAAAHLRGQHQPQRFDGQAVGFLRQPVSEIDQLGQQRGVILQRANDRLELFGRHAAGVVPEPQRVALHAARAERYQHARARHERDPVRNGVGEKPRNVFRGDFHHNLGVSQKRSTPSGRTTA